MAETTISSPQASSSPLAENTISDQPFNESTHKLSSPAQEGTTAEHTHTSKMGDGDTDHSRTSSRSSSPVPPPDSQAQQNADLEANSTEGPLSQVKSEGKAFSIFSHSQKRGIVIASACGAVFSPLTAQIYLPALPTIASDFGVSITQVNLTVTTYMIFQGLTPMLIATFADASGRRPAYLFCFTVYIAANIGCALAPNYTALLVLRMLQSAGSSTTVALAQSIVADIVTSAERGRYVSYMSLPIMLAPAIGPVLGGALAQYLGWRWTFWILTILSGVVFIGMAIWMPETCRGIVGDGSVRPKHWVHRTGWSLGKDLLLARRRGRNSHGDEKQDDHNALTAAAPTANANKNNAPTKRKFNILRTLLLLRRPDMFLLLMYSSLVFANFYCLMTSIPAQFSRLYGLTDLQIGLTYLPLGLGVLAGSQTTGLALDWNFRRHCGRLGIPHEKKRQLDLTSFPLERARLEVGIPALVWATAIILVWGWVLQAQTHLAVPCILLFLAGIGLVGFTNTVSVLIVDVNPQDAGAATAANNLTRCLVGAAASAAIEPMIVGLGSGWAFTILAALSVVFAPPCLVVVLWKGMGWRTVRKEKREARERVEKEKSEGAMPTA